jgi:ATP-dependent DNA helicase 2 subunit 1
MDFDESSSITAKNESNQEGGELDDLLFLENDFSEQQFLPTKDCIVFLVDCHQSMHSITQDSKVSTKTTPISTILKVTENFLKSKIISNQSDLFGMVLFNTSISNNDLSFEGINNLFNIDAPNAILIKKIKIMCQNCDPEVNSDNYKKELYNIFKPAPNPKSNNLSNALWEVHSLLKNYDKKSFKRRVFLFTDNDDPISDNQEKNICIQRAKDMNDSDITIELFPMNFSDKRFNLSNFYAQIIPANSDDDLDGGNDNLLGIEQCTDRLRELTKRIRQKEIKKRTLGKCPFFLTNNTKIYMNVYSSLKKSNKGKIYNVDAKTNKLLKGVTSIICKDSGAELYPEQVGNYQLYGNKKIIFSKEEMNKIKFLEEPGMKLMGFKSIDSIKPYYNVRESYFLYPNELFSNGSGKLVDALLKQMANKKKCAIVKFVAREGSTVKFCALMPQLEKYDEDYFQTPPGFNMIILPWADDIRSNSDILAKNPKNMPNVSEEQSELAKKIIKKMNISFDCRAFENVELQKFYSTLQALALEEMNADPVEDTMQPHNEGLKKVLDGLDEKFREAIFGDRGGKVNEILEKYAKGAKSRKRSKSKSDDSEGSRSQSKKKGRKKKKKEDIIEEEDDKEEQGGNYSDEVIKKLLNNKKLEKMTVPELKDICRIRNIATKGLKKVDIIDKIKNYLEKE